MEAEWPSTSTKNASTAALANRNARQKRFPKAKNTMSSTPISVSNAKGFLMNRSARKYARWNAFSPWKSNLQQNA